MSYQASHDALTGLVNRREFERRLQEALESAHDGGQRHVLCYLDLDRFKAVNDECGHTAGDSMLREVAALIKDAVRDSDTVGRLGGDEFGILLAGCPLEKARQIADDVVRAVGRLPLRLEGQDLQRRRQHRPRRGLARERLARGPDQRGGLGLLRREEAGRARPRLLGPRRGGGAQPRRDPLAAAAAVGAQGRPLRAVRAADRRGRRRSTTSGPGLEVLLRLRDENGAVGRRRPSSCVRRSATA